MARAGQVGHGLWNRTNRFLLLKDMVSVKPTSTSEVLGRLDEAPAPNPDRSAVLFRYFVLPLKRNGPEREREREREREGGRGFSEVPSHRLVRDVRQVWASSWWGPGHFTFCFAFAQV